MKLTFFANWTVSLETVHSQEAGSGEGNVGWSEFPLAAKWGSDGNRQAVWRHPQVCWGLTQAGETPADPYPEVEVDLSITVHSLEYNVGGCQDIAII